MKALSIRQPWAFSIIHGGKDIENRSWPTRYRGPLAVHAAKGLTEDEIDVWKLFLDARDLRGDWLTGKTIGDLYRGGIIGVVDVVGCVQSSSSPWFNGQYGFVLANPRPIEPVACKGRLGFFDLPAEIAAIVSADLHA
ncbi:MAG: ASCH domain-containing protein [Sphingomonas sp.]|nr:ASCH domain-containing protein [Sphingomonas sp.]MDX3885575.1 ASCH domain-containing protein [Sphingomonas sp.]